MSLRIFSWNILHHYPNRNPPLLTKWGRRKDKMIAMINNVLKPDVIGFQEPSPTQVTDFKNGLVGLSFVDAPEQIRKKSSTAIFYRPSRVTLVSSSAFVINHVEILRVSTLAVFQCNLTGKQFLFINTHFEKRGTKKNSSPARIEAAKLLAQHSRGINLPCIVTGDFNAPPSFPCIKEMKKHFWSSRTKAKSFVGAGGSVNTHLGNECLTVGKEKKIILDYIFCSKHVFSVDKYVVHCKANMETANRYLSDHRPVMSIIKFSNKPAPKKKKKKAAASSIVEKVDFDLEKEVEEIKRENKEMKKDLNELKIENEEMKREMKVMKEQIRKILEEKQ